MDQKRHNLVKRWILSVKHLESPKFKHLRQLEKESKRKEPSLGLNDLQGSPSHLLKRSKPNLHPKGAAQQKEEDYCLLQMW